VDYIFYTVIGILAGATGAASSGGGLLSIPLLLLMGFSPVNVIATTRIGSLVGGISSLHQYIKLSLVEWRYMLPYLAVISAAAGVAGPLLVVHLNSELIKKIVGTALAALCILLLTTKSYGLLEQNKHSSDRLKGTLLTFPSMVYATMFGAGGGALIINIMIHFFGQKINKAVATGLAVWIVGTFIAALSYALQGLVMFDVAVPLVIGSIVGGYIGARFISKTQHQSIKLILGVIIGISAIKILFF